MIDITQFTGFQWDAGNDRKSVDKHKVSRAEAEQVFFNDPLMITADDHHSSHREQRLHVLGRTDQGRVLLVAFTLRDGERLLRVISVRDANRRERARYVQST